MLKSNYDAELTPFDFQVFESFVPADHYLRKLKGVIECSLAPPLVAGRCSPDHGRGAIDPVLLFKLSLWQFHYDLSDEEVIRHSQVNLAFRFFLDLPAQTSLPEPSLLAQFRTRLGEEQFAKAFQEILRQARGKAWSKIVYD
jgi:transposase